MRVLIINSVCGVKSTGRICTDLLHMLEKNKENALIAYGRECADDYKSKAIRIGNSYSVKLDALITRLFDNAGLNSIEATKQLLKVMEKYNPDIVHIHNLHGYYLNYEMLLYYLCKRNIPTVCSMYDCWLFTGHCTHFDYIGCEKWKMVCQNCPQKKEYPKSIFLDNSKKNYIRKKNLLTNCDNITYVVPSKWLKEMVACSFLSSKPIEILPNGIDLKCFKITDSNIKQQYSIENKKLILAVASDWNQMKGYEYLFDIAKVLDNETVMVVIGASDTQISEFPSNVIGLKRTNSKEELAAWYSAADVFVNPTLQETQGLTNIEALACGTPVVTFSSGGSSECIKDGCGKIIARGDIEGFCNSIKEVLASHERIDPVFISNSVSHYDEKKCNNQYYQLYKKILERNNR